MVLPSTCFADAIQEIITKENVKRAIIDGGGVIDFVAILSKEDRDFLLSIVPQTIINELRELSIKASILTEEVPQFDRIIARLGKERGTLIGRPLTGYTVSGLVDFFGSQDIPVIFYSVNNAGTILEFFISKQFGFEAIDPRLKRLNSLGLADIRFIVSTFDYDDPSTGLSILAKGLNIVTYVNLKNNTLSNVSIFAKSFGSLYPDRLNGTIFISPTIIESTAKFSFPMHVAVDFEQQYLAGKRKYAPTTVQSVQLKSPILSISPFTLELGIEGALELVLINQISPLVFTLSGTVSPSSATAAGKMHGLYSSAFGLKWLALGNMHLELAWQYEAMAAAVAMGIPFTGLSIGGEFAFGDGADKTTINLRTSIGVGLKSVESPILGAADDILAAAGTMLASPDLMMQFGLYGSVDVLTLGGIVSLFKSIVFWQNNSTETIESYKAPTIRFTDVKLGIALTDLTAQFKQGVWLEGQMNMLGVGGIIAINIALIPPTLTAMGMLDPIITPFFSLSGFEKNDPILVSMGASVTTKPHMYLDGLFTIPFLGLHQGIRLALDLSGFSCKTTFAFAGFQAMTTLQIPMTNFDNLLMEFVVDNLLSNEISKFNNMVHAQLDSWAAAIKSSFDNTTGKIIKRIEDLEEKIKTKRDVANYYKKECDQKGWIRGFEACVTKITKGLDSDINELVKQANKLTNKVVDEAKKVPTMFFKTAGILVDLPTVIQIKKITGRLTGAQIKAAQMPSAHIEIVVTFGGKQKLHKLSIDGFDLKNPIQSTKQISMAIIKVIESMGTGYTKNVYPATH